MADSQKKLLVVALVVIGGYACPDSSEPTNTPTPNPSGPWSVPTTSTIRALVVDEKRRVVYASQPDSQRVLVLSLARKAYDSSLTFAGQPRGLDLSPGGDSLFVAERNTSHVTVLNLVSGVRSPFTVNTFPLFERGPDAVHVMGNNKALATITFDGVGFGGNLVLMDLAADTFRTLAGLGEYAPMTRSADRTSALIVADTWCCALVQTLVYHTSQDTITVDKGSVSAPHFFPSANSGGSRFLIGPSLFSGTLDSLGSYAPTGAVSGVLAPDGLSAYFAMPGVVTQIRLADRAALSNMQVVGTPYLLALSPDGRILIAATPGFLHVGEQP